MKLYEGEKQILGNDHDKRMNFLSDLSSMFFYWLFRLGLHPHQVSNISPWMKINTSIDIGTKDNKPDRATETISENSDYQIYNEKSESTLLKLRLGNTYMSRLY